MQGLEPEACYALHALVQAKFAAGKDVSPRNIQASVSSSSRSLKLVQIRLSIVCIVTQHCWTFGSPPCSAIIWANAPTLALWPVRSSLDGCVNSYRSSLLALHYIL